MARAPLFHEQDDDELPAPVNRPADEQRIVRSKPDFGRDEQVLFAKKPELNEVPGALG